jgi:hypothetical protein
MPVTLYIIIHVMYEMAIYRTIYIVLSLKYRKIDDVFKAGEISITGR